MKKIELNDLLQILGMVGLIASLIFVGLDLRQNQQVARITAYQALTEQIHDINSLLVTDSEISDIVNRALQNQELTASEERKYKAFFRILRRQSGLAFLQYETGIIDELLLERTIDPMMVHIRRGDLARAEWDNFTTELMDSEGNVPAFEQHINTLLDE